MTTPSSASAPPRLDDPHRLTLLRRAGLTHGAASPVLDRLASLAARLTGAPVSLVTLIDDDRQHFPGLYGLEGPAAAARGTPLSHAICHHVVTAAAPLAVEDARHHPLVRDNPAIVDIGVVAYLGVPLTTEGGHTLGALCAIDTRPRRWREDDVGMLQDLAAAALAEIRARDTEARYRLALEATQDAIYTHDYRTNLVLREGAVPSIYGRPAHEIPAGSDGWLALVHPDDRARVQASWERAHAMRAERWSCEYRIVHPDGTVLIVHDRARLLSDAAGVPQHAAGAISDVTVQRVAEEALRASEERWRQLLECAHEGICTLGPTGEVTYANPRLAAMLGVAREDVEGHPFFTWLDPAVAFEARTRFARQQRGLADTRELPLRRRDGTVLWTNQSASMLGRADGSFAGVVLLLSDISANKEAERALAEARDAARASEERSRASFDAMPGSMAVIDPETLRFVDFNDTACAQLGYTREEFAQLTVADLEAPGEVNEVRRLAAESAAADARLQFRRRHRTKAGEVRDVLVTTRAFESGGRRLSYCSWIDVTEQARAEAQRAALEERLRLAQKLEAVGQLAGGIAHDFNNLLTVIVGNLEWVRDDLPAQLEAGHPVREGLHEIHQAADRARSLVRQLLTFSRKQPVEPRRLRLGALVRDAERLLRRVIGEEITLVVHTDDDRAVVHADPGQLEQVLMNIAVNARDAMLTPLHGHPGTGGTLTIDARAVTLRDADVADLPDLAAGPYVRLVVRDTGHGMTPETAARAFEPFFTTKDVGSGTGLGLSTAHGIVQQARGAIRVESAPGAGTTITILLPDVGGAPDGTPSRGVTQQGAAAAATILIVEDETAVRAVLRRTLERAGYLVLEARHGREALQLWRQHRETVAAVVTDMRMPEMGGLELAGHLHADDAGLPILFLTGYADMGGALPPGPRERLVEKPFSAPALLEAVAGVLGARAN